MLNTMPMVFHSLCCHLKAKGKEIIKIIVCSSSECNLLLPDVIMSQVERFLLTPNPEPGTD